MGETTQPGADCDYSSHNVPPIGKWFPQSLLAEVIQQVVLDQVDIHASCVIKLALHRTKKSSSMLHHVVSLYTPLNTFSVGSDIATHPLRNYLQIELSRIRLV